MVNEIVPTGPDISLYQNSGESYFKDPRFKTRMVSQFKSSQLVDVTSIDVIVHHPRTGQKWDITQFVDGISYSEDYQTPFASIELSLINTTNILKFVQPGMWVSLHGPYYPAIGEHGSFGNTDLHGLDIGRKNYREIDRGQIVNVNAVMGDDRRVSVLAKDPAWLLAKNKIPYRLPEGTIADRLRFMEVRGFLSLERQLPDIDYILPATRGGQESIWEDIMFDVGEINKNNGTKYVFRHRSGKFYLIDISKQIHMWSFEIGSNVMQATKQMSIEDFYNLIYVIGQEDSALEEFGLTDSGIMLNVTASAADLNSIPHLGQHILTLNEQLTTSVTTAQQQAEELLKEYNKVEEVFSIQTFSIPGIRWGDKVLVYEPTFDAAGIFHVLAVHHQITNGSALMTLNVKYDSPAPDVVRQIALDDIANFLGVDASELELDPSDFESQE